MTKFYFTEIQSFACVRLKTWKDNVSGIKLEIKVTSLHKIHFEEISSFLLNKYVVHDF